MATCTMTEAGFFLQRTAFFSMGKLLISKESLVVLPVELGLNSEEFLVSEEAVEKHAGMKSFLRLPTSTKNFVFVLLALERR